MSVATTPPKRKLPVAKLAVGGVVVIVAAVLLLRGVKIEEVRAYVDRFVEIIRDAGPVVFFLAMAILPALGVPLSLFALAAGDAFASRMTMPGVIVTALAAMAANLAVAYWLARYALRPPLSRLVAHYGYNVPRVTSSNALGVTVIVRFTGAPFFLQNCVLGLAEVPFGLYLLVSALATGPFVVAFIVLGKAVREGGFAKIATGVAVLVVAIVLVQVLRRKFTKRED
jgi:uncharacterized membrane protein YdjX (TVP38/TMEM64 family)